MKSFKDAMQLGTDINNLCSKIFLKDDPDDMTFSFSIEDNGGEEVDGFSVCFDWCAVDLGYPVERSTILETKEVPGYRVWVGAMKSGGHWEPDYMDDVTICETVAWGTAVQAVLHEYVDWRWGIVCEESYADDIQREEV